MSDEAKPANEADLTDIGQDLVEQDEWAIAGYARAYSGAGHRPSVSVPSATVASARDGMVILRLVREPA